MILTIPCHTTCIYGQDSFAFDAKQPPEIKKQPEHARRTVDFLKKGNVRLENKRYHQALKLATSARKYCDDFKSLNLLGVINARLGYCGTSKLLFDNALRAGKYENLNLDTIYFNQAGLHLENGEYNGALLSLNAISSPEAFIHFSYYNGVADYHLENIGGAINELKDAIGLDPKNADAYYYLGMTLFDVGNYDAAAVNLNNAVKLDKGNIKYLIAAATVSEKTDDDRVSLSLFSKVIQKDPENIIALLGAANLSCKLGHYQKAINISNKVIDLDRKSFLAYYTLANVAYDEKKFEEATAFYEKTIKINPGFAPAYVGLGHIKSQNSEYNAAIQDYSAALWIDPKNLSAYEGRGIANFRSLWYDQAVDDFNQCLQLDSSYKFSYDAYISKGFAEYNTGKFETALCSFEQAVSMKPRKATGYDGLGCVYYALDKFKEAISGFTTAIRLDPKNDALYTNRGNALYRITSYSVALKDFDKAVKLNRSNEQSYNGQGICLHQLERYKEAISALQKGINIAPLNVNLRCNMGISRGIYVKELRDGGQEEEAKFQYDLMLKDHEIARTLGMDPSAIMVNLGYLLLVYEEYDSALNYLTTVSNPYCQKYASNNIGVVMASRDNGKDLSKAFEYFNGSIEKDPDLKFPNPRINRALIARELGRSFVADQQTADFISSKEFTMILHKDQYYSSYFYFTLMRYLPPPVEHDFKNDIILDMPVAGKPAIEYLVYDSDESCYKTIIPKAKIKNLRNSGKSKANLAFCPNNF
ncbi:MAG: tetratricopeptide repeat protein [Saprospiraceae bacterium]